MTPQEQFDAIQEMVHKLVDDQYRYYGDIQQKLQATACILFVSTLSMMTSGCGWKAFLNGKSIPSSRPWLSIPAILFRSWPV